VTRDRSAPGGGELRDDLGRVPLQATDKGRRRRDGCAGYALSASSSESAASSGSGSRRRGSARDRTPRRGRLHRPSGAARGCAPHPPPCRRAGGENRAARPIGGATNARSPAETKRWYVPGRIHCVADIDHDPPSLPNGQTERLEPPELSHSRPVRDKQWNWQSATRERPDAFEDSTRCRSAPEGVSSSPSRRNGRDDRLMLVVAGGFA